MPRHSSDNEEPLDDKTESLTLHNKRTERLQRKKAKNDQKRDAIVNLTKLPTELLLECLKCLQPSDVFNFSFVNRRFYNVVNANATIIGDAILSTRYNILAQCFPAPKLLSTIDPGLQALLVDPKRQAQLGIHRRPYQHIQSPDPHQLCTCLTCILTWNNLGLVLDFARWQDNLDSGDPIPTIPRGQVPEWNTALIARNARIARKATENSLWHVRILEAHLDSTIRSIRRHSRNKGNQRTHVSMTDEDACAGTDGFLSKFGPPSLEFPYQRDEYYMLEAYLPNRWWRKIEARWIYIIAGHHERDLELVRNLAKRDHQLAQLSHIMACIDEENWMTDVLYFKTSMVSSEIERAASASRPLKHYAAVV